MTASRPTFTLGLLMLAASISATALPEVFRVGAVGLDGFAETRCAG
jgi:hypothetical protein